MNIVGGTYQEYCVEPHWENIFGSGLRACLSIRGLDDSYPIKLHTAADSTIKKYLLQLMKSHNIGMNIENISKTPIFEYDYPLATPRIKPRPDVFFENRPLIKVNGENILYFGMLEADVKVMGSKVVYDPQSPSNPKSFTQTRSKANKLVTVVNLSEARLISGKKNYTEIVEYFFKKENCYGLILKMGARGAFLFDDPENKINIPVYKTNKVWPIGSGDIFSSIFSFCWFQGESLESSANKASLAVANYVNTKSFNFNSIFNDETYTEFYIKKILIGVFI